MLAHSMGLGKTLSVIAFLHTALVRAKTPEGRCYVHYRQGKLSADPLGGPDGPRPPRALVLVPKSVGSQWMSELGQWLPAGTIDEPKLVTFIVVQVTQRSLDLHPYSPARSPS